MRPSWPDQRNPREVRSSLDAQRAKAISSLADVAVTASGEYLAQIESARLTLGVQATNFNYVPSLDVSNRLDDIDVAQRDLTDAVSQGPFKTRASGLDAPIPTQLIRSGQF
jgi:hypothetical protein